MSSETNGTTVVTDGLNTVSATLATTDAGKGKPADPNAKILAFVAGHAAKPKFTLSKAIGTVTHKLQFSDLPTAATAKELTRLAASGGKYSMTRDDISGFDKGSGSGALGGEDMTELMAIIGKATGPAE
jgi:hypothetical protein